MQKLIFKKHRFTDPAKSMFQMAQGIAVALEDKKVRCSHLLAAIAHLAPDVIKDVLGKSIADWVEDLDVDWENIPTDCKELKFEDELCALLLDNTEEAPLTFIREMSLESCIGPAELAFIILKEPTAEVVNIIIQHGVTNDFDMFCDQLDFNYLTCREKHSGIEPRARLQRCIELGKRFSEFMNRHLVGQEREVEAVATSLVNFWFAGNKQKPLPILLLAQPGGGKSFFAQTMQEAFVELGLQQEVYPALDISCFTHSEATDSELLGEDKTYRNAHPGKIYDWSRKNRRGVMVFENIQSGCASAKRILSALVQNTAYDKFHQKNVRLPFNILVFTLTLSESQYDFLMKNGTDTLDARHLRELLLDKEDTQLAVDFSLINTIQDFVCVKELSDADMHKMVEVELESLKSTLLKDYQVSLTCPVRDDFVELLLQSVPHKISPKELRTIMTKYFSDITRVIAKSSEVECIEIQCDKLPEYPHEISRRVVRGDYLTFRKQGRLVDKTYIFSFEEIKYVTQGSIECGAYRIERPKNVSLDDIVGLDDLKLELQDSVDYIMGKYKHSQLPPPALAYILHGEPGTGKTAVITAFASSCGIPAFFANSAIFADARKLDDLFSKAKKMAPAIIVLEEINSLGSASHFLRVDAINILLAHLDGAEAASPILVLGSTNHVDQLEPALRRPGRFSRIVHVGMPSAAARRQYIKKFEHQYSCELVDGDREAFVRLTEGKTIAVVKAVLEHGLRTSIRNGMSLNRTNLETAFCHVVNKENTVSTPVIGFRGE